MEEEIDWEQELYGGGYLQVDRERDRQRKVDFWAALDGMSSGVALMVIGDSSLARPLTESSRSWK